MSENRYRLFAAIPLPAVLRSDLSDWCGQNKSDLPFQKWTHPDDVHITLFFLGETEKHLVPAVSEALATSAAKHPSFRLQLDRLGSFGPPASPSILWVGLAGDLDRLKALQKDVMSSMVELGFPKDERAYKPHITLARKFNGSSPWNPARLQYVSPFPTSGKEWTSSHITLYRSRLGQTPMYETVSEFCLTRIP